MKTTSARSRITGVQAGEVIIDLVSMPSTILAGKFILMDGNTGDRFGMTNRNVWSEKTLAKMQELLDAMEEDVLQHLFPEDTTSRGEQADPTPSGRVQAF